MPPRQIKQEAAGFPGVPVPPVRRVDFISDISGVIEGLAVAQPQVAAAHWNPLAVANIKMVRGLPHPLRVARIQLHLAQENLVRF